MLKGPVADVLKDILVSICETYHYKIKALRKSSYRPCFVALKCVTIRGRLRVYAHITVEGDPIPKYTKSGDLKHPCGKGLVGVDLGPQSVAAVSDTSVILENLAERNSKSTKRHERKE